METIISIVSFPSKRGRTDAHTPRLERMYDLVQMSMTLVNVCFPSAKIRFGFLPFERKVSHHQALMHLA